MGRRTILRTSHRACTRRATSIRDVAPMNPCAKDRQARTCSWSAAARPGQRFHPGKGSVAHEPGGAMTAATKRVPETRATAARPARSSRPGPWPLLAVAAGFLMVGNGRYTIAVAPWLGPAILLRFLQGTRAVVRLVFAGALLTGVFVFQFGSMIPLPAVILAPVALGVRCCWPGALRRSSGARGQGRWVPLDLRVPVCMGRGRARGVVRAVLDLGIARLHAVRLPPADAARVGHRGYKGFPS